MRKNLDATLFVEPQSLLDVSITCLKRFHFGRSQRAIDVSPREVQLNSKVLRHCVLIDAHHVRSPVGNSVSLRRKLVGVSCPSHQYPCTTNARLYFLGGARVE